MTVGPFMRCRNLQSTANFNCKKVAQACSENTNTVPERRALGSHRLVRIGSQLRHQRTHNPQGDCALRVLSSSRPPRDRATRPPSFTHCLITMYINRWAQCTGTFLIWVLNTHLKSGRWPIRQRNKRAFFWTSIHTGWSNYLVS